MDQTLPASTEMIFTAAAIAVTILLRVIPTKKNLCWIHALLRVIDTLIPNRYKYDNGMQVEKGEFMVTKKVKK